MGGYRLYHINNWTGHIDRSDMIDAPDDAAAIVQAMAAAGPHAMELWQLARQVRSFERAAPDARFDA